MHKPLFRVAVGSVAAVGGLIVASAMPAGAATAGRAETMDSCTVTTDLTTCSPTPTTVTFTVTTSGTLSMSAPTADALTPVSLGSAADGDLTSGSLGLVSVADDRNIDSATWTVSVNDSDFTTGTKTGNSLIPGADATYATGTITSLHGTAGAINGFGVGAALATTPVAAVSEASFNGANDASWNPTIGITVPLRATSGIYTGTITHSLT